MNRANFIAFDLDGTLVDSLGPTIETIQEVCGTILGRVITEQEVVQHFGHPEEYIFRALLAPDVADRVLNEYLSQFRHRVSHVQLFEGILEGLERLTAADFKLALFTARGRSAAQIILDHFKLTPYFQFILTGSDVSRGKPHPMGLERVAQNLNTQTNKLTYIGDSDKDILMARATQSRAVGVTWCHHCDRTALSNAMPDHQFESPRDLFDFLVTLA